ncbi:sugar transferase [Patescibacteria group bacterium]|nr:sugar transferase [Patescibacteria group bacterium]MBU1705533.1 sugar transferase [Patescibacteria group bacterium]
MKRVELLFTLLLIPFDFLALLAAGIGAFYLRYHPYFVSVRPVIFDLSIDKYLSTIIPIILVWLLLFAFAGLYSTRRQAISTELTKVALACSASMAVVFAILFFSRVLFESRFIAVAAWLLAIFFVGLGRLVIRALQRSLLKFGIGTHRVVIIGQTRSSLALIDFFRAKRRFGFEVVEQFPAFDDEAAKKIKTLKRRGKIDEIILADPNANQQTRIKLLAFTETEQIHFKYTADLFAAAVGRSIIHTFAGVPVIEVQKTPLDGWGAIYKRIFDLLVSLILIVLTAPIQFAIIIALFIEQPGRVLFSLLPDHKKVTRVGQGGRLFHYFKFRSMVKDAHKMRFDPEFVKKYGNLREGTPLFKLKDDPRVTQVGRFLRKYSLDEIPEFYLVFMGRMSLVGPRPHLPEEVAQYRPEQKKVLTIKPGITGMAQISGRADLDFDEEVRLDIHYIEHWSPWLDLYILLKTPLVVLFRKGAY